MTVQINLDTPEGLRSTLEGVLTSISDTQTALARLAGPGIVTQQALEGSGVSAFRLADGRLRLAASTRRHTVEHDGETYVIEASVPGVLDAEAASHLSADEAAAVGRYRSALADVNGLRALGVRALPGDHIGRLMMAAESAPAALRGELSTHARGIAGACAANVRRHGSLASSSAGGSGVPGQSWVADDYMPDVLDVTDQGVGLYDAVIRQAGGPGLHPTAAVKLRVLTGTGGMNIMGRQTTNTVGAFPKTDVSTTVAEITGGRAVHASLIDGATLRDPREALDWLALHRRAGALGRQAAKDYTLIHGDQQTAASSHAYASAGLAALVLDHRDAVSAGSNTDPLIMWDGLRTIAVDRSTTKDLATLMSVSASAVYSTQANALAAHKLLRGALGDQYKSGSVVVVTQSVVDQWAALSVGVLGTPFFTAISQPGNPWLKGMLFDGTMVYAHFGVSRLFSSSGVVASGAALDAAVCFNPQAFESVAGADDGRFTVAPVVDGDASLVTTFYQAKLFSPTPSGKKPVSFAYNFSV